ncbi:MAG: hypothetical protein ACRDP4_13730, partial [Nocardioidaceae bacterium]
MWRRLAAMAAAGACVIAGAAGCTGGAHAAKTHATKTHAAEATHSASPSPSPSHYPDMTFGRGKGHRCIWNNGFAMSVRSAHQLHGGMVGPGEAMYTVTIRVWDDEDQPVEMPLDEFQPTALIGPDHISAGVVGADFAPGLVGTLTAGHPRTGVYGYTVPASSA